MKKIKIIAIILISMFVFKLNVFAASGSLSVSSTNVYVGDNFTVSVNVNQMAAWNIHVTATGPVQNCSINQADATADAMDTNKTFTATCTATGEGTITIKLTGDVTSAIDGNAVNVSGTKTVNVTTKPVAPPSNPSTPSNPKPSNPQTQQPQNNLSKNNNIKSLSVEGYELIKVDNSNYTLTVSNSVTSVSVNATAEDSKAKVSGTGVKKLQVGLNNIEVIVTSESGVQNKINIKITRKDGYYLDDLDSILKDGKLQDADIIINADSKITEEEITKIKDSKKTLRFNYYNENKKLIYSWTINGKEIKDSKEFLTTISYTSDNIKEIYELSNYADGLYINFKHNGDLSNGTKIKLYVGDKFDNGNVVNVYHYNNVEKKLNVVKNNLNVVDGYIEFDLEHCSEYFVTMSVIGGIKKIEKSETNIFMILTIIELIVIVGLAIFIFVKFKPVKKEISNILENNNNNNFNKIEAIQEFTNVNNYLNNTNMNSSNDNSNLYQ